VSALAICIIGGLYRRSRRDSKLLEMFKEESLQRGRAERALDQSEKELAEDLENTRRLHNLAARYVSHQDLDTVLSEMVDAAMGITHSSKGTLQFFDPETQTLQIRAAKGFSSRWLAHFQTVHGDGATCGESMRTKARVIVADVRLSPIFAGTPSLTVQL